MLREASLASSAGSFATKMKPSKRAANGEADRANRRGEWSCRSGGTRRLRRANWSASATPFGVSPENARWTLRSILLRFPTYCVHCNRRVAHHHDMHSSRPKKAPACCARSEDVMREPFQEKT